MAIRIHHPRLLVAVLLLIVGISSSAVLWAHDSGQGSANRGDLPEGPIFTELSDDEGDGREALKIIEESGIVDSISGGQDWETADLYPADIAGIKAVRASISWKDPVISSGPWKSVRCQGTRQMVMSDPFSNVTHLGVYADLTNKQVVGYSVSSPEDTETADDTKMPVVEPIDEKAMKVDVYDFKSGKQVFRGTLDELGDKLCPEGTKDD